VGDNPRTILLAVMGTTALFSMWISNTATTALMLSVVLPISELIPSDDPYRKALLLGVPFAANIGGMATPIGTPPNALAIGRLGEIGISISFPLWMVLSLPIMLALLVITWRILLHAFPPTISHVVYTCEPPARPTLEQKAIGAIFGVTVLLWLTTGVHGIPSAVVALIPTVILLGSGLVAKEDLRGLGWEILILVGAGLSLGVAIDRSGLGAWVVTALHMDIMPIVFASVMFVVLTLIMTTFMSNTATASLLIPIAMGIGRTTGSLAVSIAVTSSVAMALPVSTAPNAIAYSSGILRVWDMVRVGTIVSLIAIVLILGPGLLYWRLFSILR
jgi:sodium-dependent dicarboxylate transporter 2/3/5